MYGLYRAWFGGGGAAGTGYHPCLQDTFSPPDTVVRVGNEGEHQFVAHKGVLAAHSGYLKALLASAAAATTTTTTTSSSSPNLPFDPTCATVAVTAAGERQSQRPVTSVLVSSIGGEAFAPLLNYMYTGRLEVTLDNVYSVLLATHLLHMPGALEQCRAALLRLRAAPQPPLPTAPMPTSAGSPPGTSGSILRPIPSRLIVGPPLCWAPTTPLAYPPAATMSHLPAPMQPLMRPTMPPGISIVAPRERQEQRAERYSEADEVSRSPQSSPAHRKRPRPSTGRPGTPEVVSTVSTLPFVAAAAAAFTAFAATRPPSPSPSPRSTSPAASSVSRAHSPARRHNGDRSTLGREAQRGKEVEDRSAGPSDVRPREPCVATSAGSNDGNDNEDAAGSGHDRARPSRRRVRIPGGAREASATSAVFSVVYDVACCDGPVRFHRVLNENYSSATSCTTSHGAQARPPPRNRQPAEAGDLSSENDENGGPAARRGLGPDARSPSNDSSNDGSSNGGCYTCDYCRHTFKSQYCYRKHAKRHLLPTRLDEEATGGDGDGDGGRDSVNQRQDAARGSRREVRLLDLNVQYYPCKICGCKFPSYYFVHKHRKLCHANDEERQGATEGASSRDADASPTQEAP